MQAASLLNLSKTYSLCHNVGWPCSGYFYPKFNIIILFLMRCGALVRKDRHRRQDIPFTRRRILLPTAGNMGKVETLDISACRNFCGGA